MSQHRLAQTCGAARWREGTFEEAVLQGLRAGQLRRLPFGWIAAVINSDDDSADLSA